jgi:hypothetical protein
MFGHSQLGPQLQQHFRVMREYGMAMSLAGLETKTALTGASRHLLNQPDSAYGISGSSYIRRDF